MSVDLSSDWFIKPPNPKHIVDIDTWRDFVARRHTHPSIPALSRPDYEALAPLQHQQFQMARRVYVSNLPKHDTSMSAQMRLDIERTLMVNTLNEDPGPRPGIFVSSNSGHGKSTLVRDIAAGFEEDLAVRQQMWEPAPAPKPGEPDDVEVPVVWINVPAKVSIGSLCEVIIDFFQDEYRNNASQSTLTKRVKDLLHACRTKLIVLDDITRLKMHREADQDASDWIRSLQETGATVLGIGINITGTGLLYEGHASNAKRDLLTQTRRRFAVYPMEPFTYNSAEEIVDWVAHLRAVENDLPLIDKTPGMLSSGTMPEFLFEKTNGVIGTLSKAMAEATIGVLGRDPEDGGETLTEADINSVRLDHAAENEDEPDRATRPQPRTSRTGRPKRKNGVYSRPVHGDQAS